MRANKTAIGEGEAVRLTVMANNLPAGQILDWSVKEGALSADSNDIDAPEKTKSGTVILKNDKSFWFRRDNRVYRTRSRHYHHSGHGLRF